MSDEAVEEQTEPAPEETPEALAVIDKELEIALLEGEQVLHEGEPQRDRLSAYLNVTASLLAMVTVVGLPLLPFIWWAVNAFSRKHRYWLTSSRVVVTNGIIGYRARSIPLERVSDVAISCNWLERAFGLRSVIVRDMTGEAQSGAAMLAVPDAAALQGTILTRVHEVNRHSPSKENVRMRGRPYREIEADQNQATMPELLRQIEENTRPNE
jgi:uncharacterized membrane protein YdbT with pleckstrin-like domain